MRENYCPRTSSKSWFQHNHSHAAIKFANNQMLNYMFSWSLVYEIRLYFDRLKLNIRCTLVSINPISFCLFIRSLSFDVSLQSFVLSFMHLFHLQSASNLWILALKSRTTVENFLYHFGVMLFAHPIWIRHKSIGFLTCFFFLLVFTLFGLLKVHFHSKYIHLRHALNTNIY